MLTGARARKPTPSVRRCLLDAVLVLVAEMGVSGTELQRRRWLIDAGHALPPGDVGNPRWYARFCHRQIEDGSKRILAPHRYIHECLH